MNWRVKEKGKSERFAVMAKIRAEKINVHKRYKS
jgi:hypothetical protein